RLFEALDHALDVGRVVEDAGDAELAWGALARGRLVMAEGRRDGAHAVRLEFARIALHRPSRAKRPVNQHCRWFHTGESRGRRGARGSAGRPQWALSIGGGVGEMAKFLDHAFVN